MAKKGGMGLDALDNLSDLLNAPQGAAAGPAELALDLIDEDPNQPRTADNPGFSLESIAEIGETIKARGVKSPISVRENKDAPGRYLINHGARRYRGSKWAGKSTIPAFIDNDYNEADQVIENLQRNELTSREIADFIGRELSRGRTKADIARSIGKSAAYVTMHATLLDLPEPLAAIFSTGRCRDVTVIYELVRIHESAPDLRELEGWLADESQEITRGSVKLLKEYLAQAGQDGATEDDLNDDEDHAGVLEDDTAGRGHKKAGAGASDNGATPDPTPPGQRNPAPAQGKPDAARLRRPQVRVRYNQREATLVLARAPTKPGYVWINEGSNAEDKQVLASKLQLLGIIEG